MAVLITTKVVGEAMLSVKLKVILGTDNVVGTRISVSDVVGAGMKVDDGIAFLEVERLEHTK